VFFPRVFDDKRKNGFGSKDGVPKTPVLPFVKDLNG